MKTFIVLLTAIAAFIFARVKEHDGIPEAEYNRNRTYIYCAPSFDPAALLKGKAPLLKGLGNLKYRISTKNKMAQKYFNQGLALTYGFNHGEAARSFQTALSYDSTCAMAYWGLALVLGPNYNAPLNPSSLGEINAAIANALKYVENTSGQEQALINAMRARFPLKEEKDMAPYYEAYAQKMREAHQRFPNDITIGTLLADALMNLHPWNLWLKDGTPQPWTPEIVTLLEKMLRNNPEHPGAIHYYIHATEASKEAGKATPYADKLESTMPSAAHLVHMPSHTYIRTGEYHKGVMVNERAVLADSSYIAQCKVQGMVPLVYYPHNIHFLAACAFFEGSSKKALDAAWMISRKADKKFLAEFTGVQHFYIIPYYVLVHLGKWEDILILDQPGKSLLYPRAIWHYARGMAYAAKGETGKAGTELNALKALVKDPAMEKLSIWDMNSAQHLAQIAEYTLEAELLARENQFDPAFELLKKAVVIEDNLNYTEPPDWFFSVRHSLGHWLVKAGRFEVAEKVYLEDLATFPENGWALKGLCNSLKGQGKNEAAEAVDKRFRKAWQWADMEIVSSRK